MSLNTISSSLLTTHSRPPILHTVCFDNHDCHIVLHFDYVLNVKLNCTFLSNLEVLSVFRARILLYISVFVKAHEAHADFDGEILEL